MIAFARITVVAAIAVLLAGCWPARFIERPGIVGAVVSKTDGKPIAGASVRVVTLRSYGEPGFDVVTDRNGSFLFEPLHRWGWYSPLGEAWPVPGSVEVDAVGFVPARMELHWPQTGSQKQNVGVIELTRTSP
jgi:hypothetical protein